MRELKAVIIAALFATGGCVNATKKALEDGGSGSGGSSSGGGTASLPDVGSSCGGSDRDDFDTAFADYRKSRGLSVLSRNGALDGAASNHAVDIAARGTTSHVGADGSRLGDRAKAAGYGQSRIHENIAQVRGGASTALEQWDASPGHHVGLVGDFSNYGIACAPGSDGYQYWTLVMAG